MPLFQAHPPFLAGLDWGLPWLRSQDWLLSGEDTEWSHSSIIWRCLCKACGGRRLLSRGMLQAGGEDKYFSLVFDLAGASHQIHTSWVSGLLLLKPK